MSHAEPKETAEVAALLIASASAIVAIVATGVAMYLLAVSTSSFVAVGAIAIASVVALVAISGLYLLVADRISRRYRG